MTNQNDTLTTATTLAKAVNDPARARILMALRGGELCACHLADLLELDPSTISRHVGVLRAAGLIVARKEGRWVHYRRPDATAPDAVAGTLAWLDGLLAGSREIADDRNRIRRLTSCAVVEQPGGATP